MATGALDRAPYGGTKQLRGVPKWAGRTNAGCAAGAFGGDPLGDHETREGCCRHERGGRVRAAPRGPSVGFLWGHET
eukprot:7835323-Pyramimonas_sp.AAC.1